jgi:hypothetical protein
VRRVLKGASLVLLLSLLLVAQVSAAPSAPCFACQEPSEIGPSFGVPQPESSQDPSPTAPLVDNPTTARGKGFMYDKVGKGEFDPQPVNLWYAEKDNSFLIVFDVPSGSSIMGQIADLLFTVYKMILHAIITLVGAVVFGLFFIGVLMEPALKISNQIQQDIVGPFALWKIVAAIGAVWLAWTFFIKRNIASAATQYFWMAIVVALAAVLVPVDAIRYIVSLVAGASAVVLMAGVGEDPTKVPAASTAPIDTNSLIETYNKFTSGFEELLIGQMAQLMIFKEKLPRVCEVAYEKGVALHKGVTSEDNWKYLNEIEQCKKFVETGAVADSERAANTAILLIIGIVLAYALLKIIWPAVKGQVQIMAALAVHKLLFLAAALPGPLKTPAIMALYKVTMGILATILVALYMSGILIGMKLVLAATVPILPMFWCLLIMLAIPLAAISLHKAQQKASSRREKELQKSIERERTAQPVQAGSKFNRAEQFVLDNATFATARKVVSKITPSGGNKADYAEETKGDAEAVKEQSAKPKSTGVSGKVQDSDFRYDYAESSKSGSEDELKRSGYHRGRPVYQDDIIGTAHAANGNGNGHKPPIIPDPPAKEEPKQSSGLVKGALDIATPAHPDEYGKKPSPDAARARQEQLQRLAERNRKIREGIES